MRSNSSLTTIWSWLLTSISRYAVNLKLGWFVLLYIHHAAFLGFRVFSVSKNPIEFTIPSNHFYVFSHLSMYLYIYIYIYIYIYKGFAESGKHTLRKKKDDMYIKTITNRNHSNYWRKWVQVSWSTHICFLTKATSWKHTHM